MKAQEIKRILALHEQWLFGHSNGMCAYLYRADLCGADLRNADLRNAEWWVTAPLWGVIAIVLLIAVIVGLLD